MKPVSFEYYAPTSVDEALENLAQLGYSGKVLAGGQSLIPAMNFRMAQPTALVDLNRVAELFYIKPASDGGLLIGTMTRDTKVEHDPLVLERAPMIVQAMPHIAHPQIRNRGTFGGALAHADPAGQLPCVVTALNAKMKVRSKNSGERWVPVDEFITGPFTTVLEPEDMLVEVAIPPLAPHSGSSYQQVSRQRGSQVQVGVASVVTLDDKKRCSNARIAILGVGEKAIVAKQAGAMLMGQQLTADAIRAAADKAARDEIDPGTDIHSTAEYRRHVTGVLVQRTLAEALDRAMH